MIESYICVNDLASPPGPCSRLFCDLSSHLDYGSLDQCGVRRDGVQREVGQTYLTLLINFQSPVHPAIVITGSVSPSMPDVNVIVPTFGFKSHVMRELLRIHLSSKYNETCEGSPEYNCPSMT